ncbi:hypothetical protein CLV78_102232 [Aliiruegeria haliotis]|uniref:Uncharacterized protein n=1 Tax=Aliiruegeria haliotis TaxID=1280846 RepID=A0A2T0RV35_9RHOB|nr:DUF6497 family protein [Aliiruegeria haliotis]PRY25055.1 hypothetical protein CLV78_102232 [Aliiruegeria haliotis]
MRLIGLGWALAFFAAAAVAQDAGLEASFHDLIVEQQSDGQTWLTLRFVSPRIGPEDGELGYEEVAGDLDRLCDLHGMTAVEESGGADQVYITLMDRVIERGVYDPEATMYIGAYKPTADGCVWQ